MKDGRIDSRIRKENNGTRYILKKGEKFSVSNAIFNRPSRDVEFVASIMCEDRFYDEDFIVAYFARDYPIPNVNWDKISNRELLAYLNLQMPRDFACLNKQNQERIKTLFLCRQIPGNLLSMLPREIMYQILSLDD